MSHLLWVLLNQHEIDTWICFHPLDLHKACGASGAGPLISTLFGNELLKAALQYINVYISIEGEALTLIQRNSESSEKVNPVACKFPLLFIVYLAFPLWTSSHFCVCRYWTKNGLYTQTETMKVSASCIATKQCCLCGKCSCWLRIFRFCQICNINDNFTMFILFMMTKKHTARY